MRYFVKEGIHGLIRSKKPKSSDQQESQEDERTPDMPAYPMSKGLSEKTEKQVRDINIRTVFTADCTLRSYLRPPEIA